MISPLVGIYHNLVGDKSAPQATPPVAAPAQQPQGARPQGSAGPSFLSNAAAASTNQISGTKSLLGQ